MKPRPNSAGQQNGSLRVRKGQALKLLWNGRTRSLAVSKMTQENVTTNLPNSGRFRDLFCQRYDLIMRFHISLQRFLVIPYALLWGLDDLPLCRIILRSRCRVGFRTLSYEDRALYFELSGCRPIILVSVLRACKSVELNAF